MTAGLDTRGEMIFVLSTRLFSPMLCFLLRYGPQWPHRGNCRVTGARLQKDKDVRLSTVPHVRHANMMGTVRYHGDEQKRSNYYS